MSTLSPTPKATSEVTRFREDLAYYSKSCLKIVTKQGDLVPLEFNRAQQIVAAKVSEQWRKTGSVKVVVLKARQEGISTWVAARFFRRAVLRKNQKVVILADAKKRGGELFKIYETFQRHLPEEYRPHKKYGRKATEMVFDTRNGIGGLNSSITVDTAMDVDAGKASTIHALHGSEVAIWPNAEDLWIGLAQAIPTTGAEVFLESTAKGVGTFFHQFWLDAVAGLNGYIPIFLPWWIHEEYSFAKYDRKQILATLDDWETHALNTGIEWEGKRYKLKLGQLAWRRWKISDMRGDERSFRQEFPSTSEEAFLVSGNRFFDDDTLALYNENTRAPEFRCNMEIRGSSILPLRTERGYLRVFTSPAPDGHYVIFGDTAKGREVSPRESSASAADSERGGRDFNCAPVYNVTTGEYVAELHGRMAPEVFAEQVQILGYYYATPVEGSGSRYPALIGIEKNHASGESVLKLLRDTFHYPNLFYSRPENRRTIKVSDTLGWTTNVVNRQRMLDELAQGMREAAVAIPSADAIREMYTFVRNADGKPEATEGTHDDRVMAYAGALQMARFSRRRSRSKIAETEYSDSPAGFWS